MQDEDQALVRVQATEAALDLVPLDGPRELIGCARQLDAGEIDLADGPARAPQLVVARSHEESVQPGLPSVGVAQRREVTPRPDKRRLDGVLGSVWVAKDEAGRGIEPGERRARQDGECLLVASLCPDDEISLHAFTVSARRPPAAVTSMASAYPPSVPGDSESAGHIVRTPPYESMTIRSWQTTLALLELMRLR